MDPSWIAERPLPGREGRGAGGDEVISRIRAATNPLQTRPFEPAEKLMPRRRA